MFFNAEGLGWTSEAPIQVEGVGEQFLSKVQGLFRPNVMGVAWGRTHGSGNGLEIKISSLWMAKEF